MKKGIVKCPIHGDNETTNKCPDCREYNVSNKLSNSLVKLTILIDGKSLSQGFEIIDDDDLDIVKQKFKVLSNAGVRTVCSLKKWEEHE